MGAELLVDLLNTAPRVHGRIVDTLTSAETARAWATERGGTGAPEEIAALRAVRDRLRAATEAGDGPEVFADLLEPARLRPVVADGRLTWELEAAPAERLAIRAVLAWIDVRKHHPGRLRPCGNPECTRWLLDRSRANSARWCSMATCGNRLKARRHYARARAAETRADRGAARPEKD